MTEFGTYTLKVRAIPNNGEAYITVSEYSTSYTYTLEAPDPIDAAYQGTYEYYDAESETPRTIVIEENKVNFQGTEYTVYQVQGNVISFSNVTLTVNATSLDCVRNGYKTVYTKKSEEPTTPTIDPALCGTYTYYDRGWDWTYTIVIETNLITYDGTKYSEFTINGDTISFGCYTITKWSTSIQFYDGEKTWNCTKQ